VKPVVALDIDGTLGRYHEHFLMFLELWLGHPVRNEGWKYDGIGEFSDAIDIDKRHYQEAKLAFRAGGFKRWMPMFGGAMALIKWVHAEQAELWITTTRPWMRMDNIDTDTREWLLRLEIPFSGLLFDEDKYGVLIERVDKERIAYVLDDQDDMYDRAEELGLPVFLTSTRWNSAIQRERMSSTLVQAASQVTTALAQWRVQHERG